MAYTPVMKARDIPVRVADHPARTGLRARGERSPVTAHRRGRSR